MLSLHGKGGESIIPTDTEEQPAVQTHLLSEAQAQALFSDDVDITHLY